MLYERQYTVVATVLYCSPYQALIEQELHQSIHQEYSALLTKSVDLKTTSGDGQLPQIPA